MDVSVDALTRRLRLRLQSLPQGAKQKIVSSASLGLLCLRMLELRPDVVGCEPYGVASL